MAIFHSFFYVYQRITPVEIGARLPAPGLPGLPGSQPRIRVTHEDSQLCQIPALRVSPQPVLETSVGLRLVGGFS